MKEFTQPTKRTADDADDADDAARIECDDSGCTLYPKPSSLDPQPSLWIPNALEILIVQP
jgi:hypothetical protein